MANGQIINTAHRYNRVSITFLVARKPLFAILNIVIPIVTISVLSMMVFLVPVESGEKLSFSLSALLSLAVFMSFISEQIPASSEKPPLLVIYLTSMVLLNALSVASTVLVLLCHHRGSVDKETRAYKSSFNPNTADVGNEKPSLRKLIPLWQAASHDLNREMEVFSDLLANLEDSDPKDPVSGSLAKAPICMPHSEVHGTEVSWQSSSTKPNTEEIDPSGSPRW
ncbi:CHRNA7-FAM7A fusion protein-like [Haliotis rubra]|uniref:CHRNA7-FAM7A fusion protein-like n=1 Tax=Haliotis rubra TaxID=36100 RepID=UPI001EE56959|nr:CHRNA7-FAM7A fusion protein-like [Haliotis rubra]